MRYLVCKATYVTKLVLLISFLMISGCGLPNRDVEDGVGEIKIFRVDHTNGRLTSFLNKVEPDEVVKRNTYLSLHIIEAYFTSLSAPRDHSGWEIAMRGQVGSKSFYHLQEGVTTSTSHLNFRSIPVYEYLPWTGDSLSVGLDVAQINKADRDRYKNAVDTVLNDGTLNRGLPVPIALGLGIANVSGMAKSIIDIALADKPHRFPFQLGLHETDTNVKPLTGPLINGTYIMIRLQGGVDDAVWSQSRIIKDCEYRDGVLYVNGKEFRDRSYVVLSSIARLLRPSYSNLRYVPKLVEATTHKRLNSLREALMRIEESIRALYEDRPYLTQPDIDVRQAYLTTYHHLVEAVAESEMDSKRLQNRYEHHMREALLAWRQVQKIGIAGDDITPSRIDTIETYLCAPEQREYVDLGSRDLREEVCDSSRTLFRPSRTSAEPGRPRPFPMPPDPIDLPRPIQYF